MKSTRVTNFLASGIRHYPQTFKSRRQLHPQPVTEFEFAKQSGRQDLNRVTIVGRKAAKLVAKVRMSDITGSLKNCTRELPSPVSSRRRRLRYLAGQMCVGSSRQASDHKALPRFLTPGLAEKRERKAESITMSGQAGDQPAVSCILFRGGVT
jgi:hypothetical protein